MTNKLRKGAYCTDIHFGKKANSQLHNEDCLRFLDWFLIQAQKNNCDYLAFLGDWNENRSALNIATLNYSYLGAKRLNSIGLPVFFCVGNHDLYHRHTREVYSVVPFQEFTNFQMIDQPVVIDRVGDGALFSPYLFHDEYPDLMKHLHLPYWAGHFEFQGFTVTGYGIKMQTGPDPKLFKGPKHIISGHFHKRQQQDNIVYMGNCFPMDFGDTGDTNRGMMVYEHDVQEMTYTNWAECPKYVKAKYSDIIDGNVDIPLQSRVRCILDDPHATFEETTFVRATWIDKFNLREFIMEETSDMADALSDTATTVVVDGVEVVTDVATTINTLDDLVVQMLRDIKSEHIDNEILIDQYKQIRT